MNFTEFALCMNGFFFFPTGIIPRSAAEIFERADSDQDYEYHVSMSYIQIYMEQV
jgi:kinesin family protein 5